MLQLKINVGKSNFATSLRGIVLFLWVELQVYLCGRQHPKFEREIRLVYSSFFFKFRFSSNPTTKKSKGVRYGD